MVDITEYSIFYNIRCPPHSLGQITPDLVYLSGVRTGALILDEYPRTENKFSNI